MTPFHFGAQEAPLFGVYTPPRATVARDSAVLLCAPIGMEYMRTHYAMRLLATQLSASGFHTLRFDYHGIGDSSGDIGEGQFNIWLDDVAMAARELTMISGVQDVIVIGLRMGAALAIKALSQQGIKVRGLVLWDPVVSGIEYVSGLEDMNAKMAAGRSEPPEQGNELLGALFPADLRTTIQKMAIEESLDKVDTGKVAVIVSEDDPVYLPLIKAMRNRWNGSIFQPVANPSHWNNIKAAYDARMTGPIVRAVAEVAESMA